MIFRWSGAAGIELRTNEQSLAIDPFFTRPPFWRLWLGRVQPNQPLIAGMITRCRYILVSHAHYDHLLDVPVVAAETGALVLGSENTCQLLRRLGTPAEQIRKIYAGDRLDLEPFQVEVLPAEHLRVPGFEPGPLKKDLRPPLHLRDYRMDVSFCFSIQACGLRLLVWCSEKAEPARPAEVLFLGLTRQKAYLKAILERVQPKVVIPIHWDDLFRPLTKPMRPFFEPPRLGVPPLQRMYLSKFRRNVAEIVPGVRVLIPEICRSYEFEPLLSREACFP